MGDKTPTSPTGATPMYQVIDWPPDLLIKGAVWEQLDRKRNKRQPNAKEVWEVMKEAWYKIPEDY